jgi:hypothetical protein
MTTAFAVSKLHMSKYTAKPQIYDLLVQYILAENSRMECGNRSANCTENKSEEQ